MLNSFYGWKFGATFCGDDEPTPTPPAVPGAPGLTLTDAGTGGTLDYALTPAAANGSTITRYEYQLNGAGGWTSVSLNLAGSISGLTDDVSVTVAFRAVNGVGEGPTASDSETPTTATTVPAAFGAGDWSLSNPASGGQLNVGISSLPSNGGSTITDVEYRVDGGSWTSSGGTVGFSITGLTDDVSVDVELRAVNAVGAGAGSDTKSATPTTAATAPAAFTAGQWSASDATTGGQANITISTLPDDGGATITDIEYQVDAGSWTSTGGTSDFNITGLTDDVEIDLKIRAVNSVGSGSASDTKAVTPTESDVTAPVINSMSFNAGTGALNIGYTEANLPTTVRWHVRLQSSGAPDEAAMLAGTGALDSGSFSSGTTSDTESISLDGGLTADDYTMYVMISDGDENHSNIADDDFTLATAPDAFDTGDWSVADAASGGQVDVTITSLPAANNATITDVEYSIDNGAWTSSGGTTSFSITGLTNGVSVGVEIRAVNSEGNGPDGVSKSVTPTAAATAPSAFVSGDWTLTDPASDGDLLVTISSLPSNGGSAITDVEYRLDGGTWTSSGGTVTFTISGLTNTTEYDVELRAINAVGNGATGDLKSATPTAASGNTADVGFDNSSAWVQLSGFNVTGSELVLNGTNAATDWAYMASGYLEAVTGGGTVDINLNVASFDDTTVTPQFNVILYFYQTNDETQYVDAGSTGIFTISATGLQTAVTGISVPAGANFMQCAIRAENANMTVSLSEIVIS